MGKRLRLMVMLLFQIAQWKACCPLTTNQEGDTITLNKFEIAPKKSNGSAPRIKRTIISKDKLWPDGPDGWPEVPYSIVVGDNACPKYFNGVGNQCLYFSSVKASWSKAKMTCQSLDATLANITQLKYFRAYMRDKLGGQSFWVGHNVQHREGTWNRVSTGMGCIEFGTHGTFDDEHCYKLSKYICEPNARPLTEVKPAVAHWESNTCITFKEVAPDYPKLFIRVVKGSGCSVNSVGAPTGWSNVQMSIGKGCGVGEAIHEFGHALGYEHEHGRSDFDKHLSKYRKDGDEWAPYLNQHQTRNDVPYDFTSLMHRYPAVPKNYETMKQREIILMPHNPYNLRLINHKTKLSWRDIKAANIAYKCIDKWRQLFPRATDCLNSGYIGKNGRCNCPPGTRGSKCQTKYADYYPPLTCGGNVTKASILQPKYSFKNERCMWWIQAPKCKKVQMTVVDFEMSRCRMNQNHLEIRTGDVSMPGTLYCDNKLRFGSIITSEDDEMFIDYAGKPSQNGFMFKVDFVKDTGC